MKSVMNIVNFRCAGSHNIFQIYFRQPLEMTISVFLLSFYISVLIYQFLVLCMMRMQFIDCTDWLFQKNEMDSLDANGVSAFLNFIIGRKQKLNRLDMHWAGS